MPSLQFRTCKRDNLIVVAASGDVDLASAETLWDELGTQLMPASDVALALDCTRITFIDSMGLQVLIRTHQHAADQHASFALIGANEYLDRVLELTGLTGLIPRFADLETARARLSPKVD